MTEVQSYEPIFMTTDYSSLDFNRPITRDNLDDKVVQSKIDACEKYLKGEINSPEDVRLVFSDITCFAYLFFRIDLERVELYKYQDLILNDKHKYKIFRAARQIGKSMALDLKAAFNLIKDHGYGHVEAIVSASLSQAGHQMTRVKDLLDSMVGVDWKEHKTIDNQSKISIDIMGTRIITDEYCKQTEQTFKKYSNMLIVSPPSNSILGYSLHELNLDEIEYWDDVDVNEFISKAEPTMLKTNGTINTFSNPNGPDTEIAAMEELTLPNGNKKYHTYVFNFFDCPGNDQEKFEIVTTGKTRQQIESQFLAIRSLSSKNYFTADEIERSEDLNLTDLQMVGKQPIFFLDVGAKHDQSVLTGGFVEPDDKNLDANGNPFLHFYAPIIHVYPVGYPISRVISGKPEKGQDSDGWHYEKSVKDYIEEWGKGGIVPILGVDVTGNSGISPLMNECGLYPTDVTMSGPVKSGMYQRYKYLMEKGFLHRKQCKEFDYQAKRLIMKKSARQYLMIHHESENDLDDTQDSMAGFIYLADNPVNVETTWEEL